MGEVQSRIRVEEGMVSMGRGEFGEIVWRSFGQSGRDAVGQDDLDGMILVINNVDGNERRWLGGRRSFLSMLFEPIAKTLEGATDVAGDLCGGSMGFENTGDGVVPNFGGITDTGHKVGQRKY
jgi:hypothetical protein